MGNNRRASMEDILAAFAVKYDGKFHDIYNAIKTKEYISDDEVESYLNQIEEDYVTIISDDYPDAFKSPLNDCPPMALFYEGNLECIDDFNELAVPHDHSRRFFMGVAPTPEGMDYCIATERQEDVEKIVDCVFKNHPEINFVNYRQKAKGSSLS